MEILLLKIVAHMRVMEVVETSSQSFVASFVHEGNHHNRAGIKIQCGEDDPDSDTNARISWRLMMVPEEIRCLVP